jgi:zinc-RING finger domain
MNAPSDDVLSYEEYINRIRMGPPTVEGLVEVRTVIVPFGTTCSCCWAPVEDGEDYYVASCDHLFCDTCADSLAPIKCGVCQAVFTFEEAENVELRVAIPDIPIEIAGGNS